MSKYSVFKGETFFFVNSLPIKNGEYPTYDEASKAASYKNLLLGEELGVLDEEIVGIPGVTFGEYHKHVIQG